MFAIYVVTLCSAGDDRRPTSGTLAVSTLVRRGIERVSDGLSDEAAWACQSLRGCNLVGVQDALYGTESILSAWHFVEGFSLARH